MEFDANLTSLQPAKVKFHSTDWEVVERAPYSTNLKPSSYRYSYSFLEPRIVSKEALEAHKVSGVGSNTIYEGWGKSFYYVNESDVPKLVQPEVRWVTKEGEVESGEIMIYEVGTTTNWENDKYRLEPHTALWFWVGIVPHSDGTLTVNVHEYPAE